MINVETQDMDLFFFIDTGDLDPGNDLHIEVLCGF